MFAAAVKSIFFTKGVTKRRRKLSLAEGVRHDPERIQGLQISGVRRQGVQRHHFLAALNDFVFIYRNWRK